MKDGVIMKENFCFDSEREWTEDCSLEMCSESFMIGRAVREKIDLGATREDKEILSLEEACFATSSSTASSRRLPPSRRVSTDDIKKTLAVKVDFLLYLHIFLCCRE